MNGVPRNNLARFSADGTLDTAWNPNPDGIQTFARLREDDCYYVDKTGFALRLIQAGKYYFLSRPRRFGKLLFLDTLAELFAGNEQMFRGLFVHDRWDWAKRYPVIRFSFGGGVVQSLEDLERKIWEQLHINQAALGLRRFPEKIIPMGRALALLLQPKRVRLKPNPQIFIMVRSLLDIA